MGIKRSKMLDDGLCVWFDNGWYYAHGIHSVGEKDDEPRKMGTMWGWINHMRDKRWWNPTLEGEFIRECEKYL